MCLAFPAKVIELKGKKAIVAYWEEKKEVLNNIINAVVGEWVLVQHEMIVERLSKEEAKESLLLLQKV